MSHPEGGRPAISGAAAFSRGCRRMNPIRRLEAGIMSMITPHRDEGRRRQKTSLRPFKGMKGRHVQTRPRGPSGRASGPQNPRAPPRPPGGRPAPRPNGT